MFLLARLLVIATLAAGLPAFAQPAESGGVLTPKIIATLSLDELFDNLPDHVEAPAGKQIEAEILKRFERSGSDTADLLMTWAAQAIGEKAYPQALDILDQVIVMKPDFAEGWNRRATVHYLRDDYASSVADIRQTLRLEPRHFGALSGLGLILESTGKKEQAMAVFRRALAIDPLLGKVRESLERLEKETARNAI